MKWARVEKPWRYSRHGHDHHLASVGYVFEIVDAPVSDDQISVALANDGKATGHLKLLKQKPKKVGA